MVNTKLDKLNNILYKIAKPLFLATGMLWIIANTLNTQFTFLQSYFSAFTLIGHIVWDIFVLYLLSCLALSKEKRKEKFVRACTWAYGAAWGVHSYQIFAEHKYISVLTANVINWTAFIIAVVCMLVAIYLAVDFFKWRRNKFKDKCV